MPPMPDALELTRQLIRLDTINPPGNEEPAARLLGELLSAAGLEVSYPRLCENRCGLVARLAGARPGPALIATGHLDTVPLGNAPWSVEPHAGLVKGGKLYGRGASDMKSGVAALAVAALGLAGEPRGGGDIILAFTAGEETGSQGASQMVGAGLLPARAGALLVAEPSGNQAFLGHKGALWLECVASGKSAHGSMPHLGDNAIYKAARAAASLEDFFREAEDVPPLGRPTINVGTFSGGSKINMVPDQASFQVDLRSVPGLEHGALRGRLQDHLGGAIAVRTLIDLPAVLTDPGDPWIVSCLGTMARLWGGRPEPGYVNFFTDASVFTPALGHPPTLILGPGDPGQAHQTDEWCLADNIGQAARLYQEIGRQWWGL
ncbi:MAG: M20 family metallopeptidase [Pseudomonadota bacterium]